LLPKILIDSVIFVVSLCPYNIIVREIGSQICPWGVRKALIIEIILISAKLNEKIRIFSDVRENCIL